MSIEQIKDNFLNVVLNHYADFNGRARRSEYWYYTLVVFCISLLLSILQAITGWKLFSILSTLVSLALLVPGLAICWRRLHDIGKPGPWYFIILIPIVGIILMLVWFCQDSQPGANEFGPNPKDDYKAAF